jgi:adenylate cyclase
LGEDVEAPPLKRKLAAILAADVEGYSRLMHDDEERTLATLTDRRAIVDALIERSNGQIFGTAGDSVLAEFPSVVQAFGCAIAMQQSVHHANHGVPANQQMSFRIGINVGDVMVKDGDIFGDGVNIAARLEALADVGGICVTRGVRDHIRDRVEANFEDMGEQSFKNIARPVRVFRVLFDADAEPTLTPFDENDGGVREASLSSQSNDDTDAAEISFWESIREDDDGTELRLYLERFPNGAYSKLARARLEDDAPPPADPAIEVTFWESVRESEDVEMIKAYIEKFRDGQFVPIAQILLKKLKMK